MNDKKGLKYNSPQSTLNVYFSKLDIVLLHLDSLNESTINSYFKGMESDP